MFWLKEQYVTFWRAEDKGNYSKGSISTSEKKQDGTYENSNWFATFVGKAHDKVQSLNEKDRIKVNGKVTNVTKNMDDGSKKTFLNVVIFDILDNNTQQQDGFGAPPVVEDEDFDDELPF